MMHSTRAAVLAAGLLVSTGALAQQPGYFIPPSGGGGGATGGAGPARPVQTTRPQPGNTGRPQGAQPSGGTRTAIVPPPVTVTPPVPGAGPAEAPPIQVQLPPMRELPAIPRGPTPPAAVIGVLGIPDIMRGASAAQQVEKTIAERREKLKQDADKEAAVWRELQVALAGQRGTMTPDQIRAKEKELQDRVTNAQRGFRDRNRFMQEAAQVGLAQIERTLIAVIRQVAESRGMNLVMHRSQVALNVNEFDITEPVVAQLNKVLPTVELPADGVSAAVAASQAPALTGTAPPDAPPAPTQLVAPPGPPRR